MHYESFTLENYKGISHPVTVSIADKSKTPTCLIGNNESGKTTILKGIELIGKLCHGHQLDSGELAGCRPKKTIHYTGIIKLSTELAFEHQEIRQQNKTGEDEKGDLGKFKVALQKNRRRATLVFCFHYKNSEMTQKTAQLQVGSECFDFSDNMVSGFLSALPDIIYLDDFSFDIPDRIRITDDGNTAEPIDGITRAHNQFWASVIEDLLKGATLNDVPDVGNKNQLVHEWWKQTPLQYLNTYLTYWSNKNTGDEDAIEQRMAKMNAFLNKVITRDWEDISGLKSSFERFEITRRKTTETSGKKYDDYQIKALEDGNSFALSERSKGCRWFFCFKLLTQIRSYRDHSQTVFLLDEPASNLHIHPQDRILKNINKLAKDKKVIYSTHAPHLIDTDKLEHCLLVENKKTNETASADIIITAYPKYHQQSSAIEPIHERVVLRALNESNLPWSKWWAGVKEANASIEILDKLQRFFG